MMTLETPILETPILETPAPETGSTSSGHGETIHDDLCNSIGRTPILRLARLSASLGVELLAKAELLNPGGSIKDRTAFAMIRAAEAEGRIVPGTTLVEATAGNTGIGLAWIAARRGYPFVAVLSEADRGPKTEAMEATGAEVVLVPDGNAWSADDGPRGVARQIAADRGGHFLDQFSNPANPRVHEEVTAPEILAAVSGRLDSLIAGVGTGGTLTGLARGLTPKLPGLRKIAVVAAGSYLGDRPGDRIPGITPDFAPATFDRRLVDRIELVEAAEARTAARRLATLEGVAAGRSSGACLVAAAREARRRPGARILIVLGDGARNYPA